MSHQKSYLKGGLGKPKIKRIKDNSALKWVKSRRDGGCMVGIYYPDFGPCCEGFDAHHITSRGAGGDDVKENLISLCRVHHNMVHNGKISKRQLRTILECYYGYNYE